MYVVKVKGERVYCVSFLTSLYVEFALTTTLKETPYAIRGGNFKIFFFVFIVSVVFVIVVVVIVVVVIVVVIIVIVIARMCTPYIQWLLNKKE